jgi:hypothetical protein
VITVKNQNFQYDYRGCVAKMKYEDGCVFISVYDKQEKINYSDVESCDAMFFSKADLIEKAQIIIDDIRDND